MAGNSGTSSTRSGKSELPFMKQEFPVLFVKEETMTTARDHNTLKQKCEFLSENLEFEKSRNMGLEKEMKELHDRFFGLKRETMLFREEKLRGKRQREEYEKLLEEMKAKERESIKTIGELKEEIQELSMAKGRAEMEVETWKSRLSELEKMVMEVAKDCLEVRSLYLNQMNRVGTGEKTGILSKKNTSMAKDADVINISDSEEDENNLPGDGLESCRGGKSLERNRKGGKRFRISPDHNRDSVSSCKFEGRISNAGFTPRPLSPSSSSTDASSSDSDAGVQNPGLFVSSRIRQEKSVA
ncbi:PREDICTED: anucleate primary sterigmata protein B-like [Tarenaya hassleriana]|uniref:anucleate primary sterigmata protein B-like n=1 Tax=Tarenaya hassleriana TaxID=28532 RepID=UPI00053C58A1|nr:PREDICTED: anucleate primary sterigmata protein B-like [Tarenaya hassleriana]XP_010541502.1 PREDICTED: anucleate primary sterigmata protein B-like [Tarenaya hassleriana]